MPPRLFLIPGPFLNAGSGAIAGESIGPVLPIPIFPPKFGEAFSKYEESIFIKTTDPKSGQEIAVALEKEAMLSYGCQFAFAMAMCVQCEACAYPEPCRYPHLARSSMDGFGVDIGKTLEPLGFKVEFDRNGEFLPAWYSMVLLD